VETKPISAWYKLAILPSFFLLDFFLFLKGRLVPRAKGKELSDSVGAYFLETSAKTGKNISEAFCQIVRMIKEHKANIPETVKNMRGGRLTKCVIF
jgi:hypothetical protein